MSGGIDPQFVDLVEEMRKAQDLYFNTKSPAALRQAKKLEMQVDKAIVDIRDDQRRWHEFTGQRIN